MRETLVRSLGWEDPLEKEMATHSSTLAWQIPWREEPGRLQSMGSQRVGHHWATELNWRPLNLPPLSPLSFLALLFLPLLSPPSPGSRICSKVLTKFISALLLLSRFSRVRLCVTPWTADYQAPPSMGFARQEYWSGLPLPSPISALITAKSAPENHRCS